MVTVLDVGVHVPLKEGDKAPLFTLPDEDGNVVSLDNYSGKKVVIYFYPKDDTPGCTKEACDFSKTIDDFSILDTVILGISRDTQDSHKKFHNKFSLKIKLLTDSTEQVVKQYGVLVEKSMFGKKYTGLERATFLIGRDGNILKIWRNVKVTGHVNEVKSIVSAA